MKTTTIANSKLFQSIITVCIFSAFGIAQNTLSVAVGDGTIDVLYNSDADIGGFQFTVEGATVTGTSGGDAAANGFVVSCNATLCLGFSFTGAVIPPGSGTLVIVSADITGDVSLTGIVVSDADGNALDFSFDSGSEEPDYIVEVSNYAFTPDHLDIVAGETVQWVNMGGLHNVDGSTDTYPDNPDSFYNSSASSDSWTYSFTFTVAGNYDYECTPHAPSMAGTITVGSGGCTDDMACNYDAGADFDDGSCLNNDCAGVCGGSAEVDECGVCGGDGIAEGSCDCDGNVLDECGVCGGDGIAEGSCDCAGNVDDCAGICGGSTEVDECGVCGGPGATGECGCDGIAEGTCDCDGNVLDECGVCGGDGIAEGSCDCAGNVDLGCGCGAAGPSGCDNACGSTLENDECGVCGGDGTSCTSTIDILYNTTTDIGGFQFNVDGVTVVGASGGAAGENGFMISSSSTTVIAFSLTGATIPADSGILVQVEVQGDADAACLSAVVLSDAVGGAIDNEVTDCFTISQVETIWGCTDELACNYNADATDNDGSCTYAEENYDCDGNCTAEVDCAGECGGSAVVDECGECGGDGIGGHACDCDGNVLDECGVCGGDGSSCAPGVYGLSLNDDGDLDVTFDSPDDIYGFQFDVSAVTVTGTSGGAATDAGFTTSTGNNTVLGFSFSGAFIPAGSGVLTVLSFEGSGEACLSNIVVSGYGGEGLETTGGDCVTIDDCVDVDADGICDDVDDCVGAYDECGVCNGDGIADGACDCAGSVEDCAGECGGSAAEDECGVCGGGGIADGACDCAGNVEDCAGDCGGSAEVDGCGECGGDGIDEGACDCAGNVEDCAGECGGSAAEDECGVCGGGGIADGACDCAGNVEDCAGDCGGSAEVDECGDCGGDGIDEGACDCAGSVEDCAGECGGSAENCPGWEDDPGAYEFTATIAGAIVLYDGVQLGDDGDLLAALDADGNVRGVGLMLFPPFGPYVGTPVYEVQLRSNDAGDLLHFQYYDASSDEVLDISETYEFVINDVIGDVIDPWTLNIQTTVDLGIDLISGWNWISFNVDPEDDSLASVLATVSETATFINSQSSGTATNYGDYGWYGGLITLDPTQMYLLDMSEAATLTVTGVPVDVASTPIDLISGWNWIGYLPQNAGDVGEALSSVGDLATFINSQSSGTASNYGDYGWYGGLTTLEPGSGYLLDMSDSGTLVYPEFDGLARLDANKQEVVLKDAISDWDFNYADYEFIGTIHASIESRIDFDGDVLGVFVDDKCRGIAERMYFPFDDSYFYIVQVYSNIAEGEEMTFKYFDSENGEVVEYAETMMFTSNMVVGDGFNTFNLSREVGDLQQPMAYGISEAYPNPFNPVTSFEYTLEKDGMVQVAIYDINGRMVSELVNGYQSAGSYPVVWDAQELSSGVYMVNMISGDYSTIQKVMLIK